MADTFTPSLNLRKPEVGAAFDTWGGVAGLNGDLDLIDAIFLATGLGTAVGLHVGTTQVLNVEGGITLKDPVDITKVAVLDRSLITTATTRTYQFPDESGTLAIREWVQPRLLPTGSVLSGYYSATPPAGFVFLDGRTIGDASSTATNRANADTAALFALLWGRCADAQCAVSGGRGASAAADYAAHKTLALPNHSGRVMAGRDDLSGTAATVLTGFNAPGFVGGEQTHTLTTAEMPVHNHGVNDPSHRHSVGISTSGQDGLSGTGVVANQSGAVFTTLDFTGITIQNAGSGGAHTNVQPTIVVDVIIAL